MITGLKRAVAHNTEADAQRAATLAKAVVTLEASRDHAQNLTTALEHVVLSQQEILLAMNSSTASTELRILSNLHLQAAAIDHVNASSRAVGKAVSTLEAHSNATNKIVEALQERQRAAEKVVAALNHTLAVQEARMGVGEHTLQAVRQTLKAQEESIVVIERALNKLLQEVDGARAADAFEDDWQEADTNEKEAEEVTERLLGSEEGVEGENADNSGKIEKASEAQKEKRADLIRTLRASKSAARRGPRSQMPSLLLVAPQLALLSSRMLSG
mmetsp:Transcript_99332/g.195103  ORF Transcript_99332/g.195103 Transcript_99332/m.195103 type:complete len:273 (-) Transcript_99332:17-835(-)